MYYGSCIITYFWYYKFNLTLAYKRKRFKVLFFKDISMIKIRGLFLILILTICTSVSAENAKIVIRDNTSIKALENNPNMLTYLFQAQDIVKVVTSDGNWTKNIYLPLSGITDGKRFRLNVKSTWAVNLHYNEKVVTFGTDSKFITVFKAGSWR